MKKKKTIAKAAIDKRSIEPGKAHPDALKCAKWLNADEKRIRRVKDDLVFVRSDDDLAAIIDEQCGLTFFRKLYDGAVEELEELEATNTLRWNADQRAIRRWQEATGRCGVWPDQADLCCWLLEQLDHEQGKLRTLLSLWPITSGQPPTTAKLESLAAMGLDTMKRKAERKKS